MKKIGIVIIALLMASCSLPGLMPLSAELPPLDTPTIAGTATTNATSTVIPRTATFTSTPTLLGGLPESTQTMTHALVPGNGVNTVTPFPTITPFPTATPIPTSTPLSPGGGFESITFSEKIIYWGICRPNKTKFTVRMYDTKEVYNVVIFTRLKDYKKDDTTPWSKGAAMDPHGDGLWTYYLKANTIDGKNNYRRAWVWYQLAAEDDQGEVIGRTHVYFNQITLEPCMCMTPPCD